jgi:Protein of unknown function (DUF2844)
MNPRSGSPGLFAMIISCGLLLPRVAQSSLGGDVTSVTADAQALGGVLQSSAAGSFELEQITTDGGLQVREYLSPGGVVFAIAWSGPVMPDLQQLLGTEFAQFAAAMRAQDHPGRHRNVNVVTGTLVAESAGHLRAYSGWAYLPAMLPAGTSPAQFR